MPGFDRTGPMGEGARTGWGRGYCGPGSRPTSVRDEGFPTRGGGRGMQRGFRRGFGASGPGRAIAVSRTAEPPQADLAAENERLRAESQRLRQRLEAVEQRLAALDAPVPNA